jgi:hypothetical protein
MLPPLDDTRWRHVPQRPVWTRSVRHRHLNRTRTPYHTQPITHALSHTLPITHEVTFQVGLCVALRWQVAQLLMNAHLGIATPRDGTCNSPPLGFGRRNFPPPDRSARLLLVPDRETTASCRASRPGSVGSRSRPGSTLPSAGEQACCLARGRDSLWTHVQRSSGCRRAGGHRGGSSILSCPSSRDTARSSQRGKRGLAVQPAQLPSHPGATAAEPGHARGGAGLGNGLLGPRRWLRRGAGRVDRAGQHTRPCRRRCLNRRRLLCDRAASEPGGRQGRIAGSGFLHGGTSHPQPLRSLGPVGGHAAHCAAAS